MLKQNNISQPNIDKIINITHKHQTTNYFSYDNKYYIQSEGQTMGSVISSFPVKIFILHNEQAHILNRINNKYSHKII